MTRTKRHDPETATARAARLLDFVAAADAPPTVSSMARDLGLPKSSVHGLCGALLQERLMIRVGDGFGIGGRAAAWAAAGAAPDVVQACAALRLSQPRLSARTLTLSVLDGADVVYLACWEGRDGFGIAFRPGMRLPAAFTATGKAMLSTLSRQGLDGLYAAGMLDPLTPASVATYADLLRELDEVRERGYSIDDGQVRQGLVCVGAALNALEGGQARYGLALSRLRTGEMDEETREAGELVRDCAGRLPG